VRASASSLGVETVTTADQSLLRAVRETLRDAASAPSPRPVSVKPTAAMVPVALRRPKTHASAVPRVSAGLGEGSSAALFPVGALRPPRLNPCGCHDEPMTFLLSSYSHRRGGDLGKTEEGPSAAPGPHPSLRATLPREGRESGLLSGEVGSAP
jgi:hypothetical protein